MKKVGIVTLTLFLALAFASCSTSVKNYISVSELSGMYTSSKLSAESISAVENGTFVVPNYEVYGNPEKSDKAPKGRNFVMVGELGNPYTYNGENVLVDFKENGENLYTLYIDERSDFSIYAVQRFAGETVEVNGSFRGFSRVTNSPMVQISGVYAGESWYSDGLLSFSEEDKMIYIDGTRDPDPAGELPKGSKPNSEPQSTPKATAIPESSTESDADHEVDNKPPWINWDKLAEDFKADIAVSDQPFYKDVYVGCNGDTITITAVVAAYTNDETVLDYVDTLIRRLGALANQQNSAFTAPGAESFGGLFDYYNVMIGIAPQGSEDNQDEWYVSDAVAKGVHTKHEFKITRK